MGQKKKVFITLIKNGADVSDIADELDFDWNLMLAMLQGKITVSKNLIVNGVIKKTDYCNVILPILASLGTSIAFYAYYMN